SIYWHMVSKLLLAVKETCLQAIEQGELEEIVGRLLEHFYEINEGIGVHKSPELYGAFSIDPYSHTPMGKGAQQPGMTGQVKEDILTRIGELGVFVQSGELQFNPLLLRKSEFLVSPSNVTFAMLDGAEKEMALKAGELAFTYCQVPVIYQIAERSAIQAVTSAGHEEVFEGNRVSKEISQKIFRRTGEVQVLRVSVPESQLK
ncbi:MAG: hypothetical protein AAF789_05825, partial [Bacteroidota bacterium]